MQLQSAKKKRSYRSSATYSLNVLILKKNEKINKQNRLAQLPFLQNH